MTSDENIRMFVNSAAWMEAEYSRLLRQRVVRWDRLAELRVRNVQLTREFLKYMETHEA